MVKKAITYKLNFIDSFRFMLTTLSSLVYNLSEIFIKECRVCKERKIKSVWNFIGVKSNKTHCKFNESKKRAVRTNKWIN